MFEALIANSPVSGVICMRSSLSHQLPVSRSSVKQATPSPTVSTSSVDGP